MPSTPSLAKTAPSAPSTQGALLDEVAAQLGALPDARREAFALLGTLLQRSRAQLMIAPETPVQPETAERVRAAAARRADGVPLAYLSGRREFWSREFSVDGSVLVPRPETETLVERALALGDALAKQLGHAPVVVDLGTGSGAIAITLALDRPGWRVAASDRSPAALTTAQRNARRLGAETIRWAEGDWLEAFPGDTFDLIVANPPYVASADPALEGDGLRHEPRDALTPGADALAALRALARAAPAHLARPGAMLLEHGAAQDAAVRALLVAEGFRHVVSRPDFAGLPRCTEGHWL
jgi:release factor glutamine methyltransferase